jgi:arginine exporter protein ArgO
MSAFLAGLVAGLGVAVPLGAIGVLLVQEGITHWWRPAAGGATGVALVDFGYAAGAVTTGSAITRALHGHERQVQLVGAAVLAVVVLRGLLGLGAGRGLPGRRGHRPATAEGMAAAPAGSPWQVLRRFVALTAVNPLTALYFVVLTAGLGRQLTRPAAAAAFVAGVFLASWAWQLLLAAVSSATGSRMPPWSRTVTALLGYALVTGYAVRLALG